MPAALLLIVSHGNNLRTNIVGFMQFENALQIMFHDGFLLN